MITGRDLVKLFSYLNEEDDYSYQKEFSNKYNKELVREYKNNEIGKEWRKIKRSSPTIPSNERYDLAKKHVQGDVLTYREPGYNYRKGSLDSIINRRGVESKINGGSPLAYDIKRQAQLYRMPEHEVVKRSIMDIKHRRKIAKIKKDIETASKPVGEYGKKVKNILKKIRIK